MAKPMADRSGRALEVFKMAEDIALKEMFDTIRSAIADARTKAERFQFDEDARSYIRACIELCIVELQDFMRRTPPPRKQR